MRSLRTYLKERGLKVSGQRDAVARAALSFDGHFAAEELSAELPMLNLATVYRTLPLLVEAGILQQVLTQGDRQLFERAFEREDHDHLMCIVCGQVIEFHSDVAAQLQRELTTRFNFSMVSRVHQISGVCAKCRLAGRKSRAVEKAPVEQKRPRSDRRQARPERR